MPTPSTWRLIAPLLVLGSPQVGATAETATTPQQLWANMRDTIRPLAYEVTRDEIVVSETNPTLQLRRLEVRFRSQTAGSPRHKMDHTAVIFLPPDPTTYQATERRGRVVVVGQRLGDTTILANYGEPIAARTGYPTMVLPVPGEFDEQDGESCWMYFLQKERHETGDPINQSNFRLAIPYLIALDLFADLLGVGDIRAIIGGHSKRATSAYMAAAMDPERIIGLVCLGQEGNWRMPRVDAKVLYIGATNEAGYQMFNINKIYDAMDGTWTIVYIPNYRHAENSELQAMAWQMWVAHVFDGRPLTRIVEPSHERVANGTLFRARIESSNKLIHVKVWYVYADDDDPYWRDLMWHSLDLRKSGAHYEGLLDTRLPDAWFVEVKDSALGFPGYVMSLPQDITHKPIKWRSGSMFPKNWQLKISERLGETIPPGSAVTLRELWARFRKTLPPLTYSVLSDELVTSHSDPTRQLRRVKVRFRSQAVGRFRRVMDHTGIIHLPFNPPPPLHSEAKAVVIGQRVGDTELVDNYGEPMAAKLGYPTMVLSVPGQYEGDDGERCWSYFLRSEFGATNDLTNSIDFRLAIPYLRALDVLEDILERSDLQGVIGGTGIRAAPVYAAAAMDPDRVIGVVYVGNEATVDETSENWPRSVIQPHASVRADVILIDGTKSSESQLFDAQRSRTVAQSGWTVEVIPNAAYEENSEVQAITWQMWVSHVFASRPVSRIVAISHHETAEGTIFQANIETVNRVIHVKAWYAYVADEPEWRNVVWYPVMLGRKANRYEGFLEGKLPDAWFVEVKDLALGVRGYVSTLPQRLSTTPTNDVTGQEPPSRCYRRLEGPAPAAGAAPCEDVATKAQ